MPWRRRRGQPSAVTERDQSGITDEQVETHAGDGEDDDVGRRGQGQADPEQHRRHQHKPEGDDQQRQVRWSMAQASSCSQRSPRRPCGRTRRTRNIKRYIEASAMVTK